MVMIFLLMMVVTSTTWRVGTDIERLHFWSDFMFGSEISRRAGLLWFIFLPFSVPFARGRGHEPGPAHSFSYPPLVVLEVCATVIINACLI